MNLDITLLEHNTYVGFSAGKGTAGADTSNVGVGANALLVVTSANGNVAIGKAAGDIITTGTNNTIVGKNSDPSVDSGSYQVVIGQGVTGEQNYGTVIGHGGMFKFVSRTYTCDHADAEDGKSAASTSTPIKLPAYSIIKSISVLVDTLSNLGTFNVSLYHSSDTTAPADDSVLGGTPIEVLGAGVAATMSGISASAVDIDLGTSAGVVKTAYHMDEAINVGSADRYIHVGQAGTGNGDTDPSTAGVINILVEYVGLD